LDKSIDTLSSQERIAYYRALAFAALGCARDSTLDESRRSYLGLATLWASLADEVDWSAQRQAEIAVMCDCHQSNGDGEKR